MNQGQPNQTATLFGHPTGLFTLFFAEMWERFSYYGMRALLLFYMLKGFLGYGDSEAYAVYGAYTALVYMTPFFGGMIADRLLGARRAVVLGGLLMAAGHLLMTVQTEVAFFTALALLIAGNGFFKPNISTIVGSLYPQGSPKRDGGFTIFYMGINLGAAMSPLLCGYIGETYGWHYGFGLATIGMLTGIAVFVAPILLTQALIGAAALAAAIGLIYYKPDNMYSFSINIFVAVSLLAAAVVALIALQRGGLPDEAGAPPDRQRLRNTSFGIPNEWLVYLCTLLAIPVLALMVCGFSPFTKDLKSAVVVPEGVIKSLRADEVTNDNLERLAKSVAKQDAAEIAAFKADLAEQRTSEDITPTQADGLDAALAVAASGDWSAAKTKIDAVGKEFPRSPLKAVAATLLQEASKPAGLILVLAGLIALTYLGLATMKLDQIARQRMYVVFILTFFSLLFWAFFEQAGSSVNNFTDRNVERVVGDARTVTADEVGKTITLMPTQAQLGYSNGSQMFVLGTLDSLRDVNKENPNFTVDWTVAPDNVGMRVADRNGEIPASWFQSINPVYILVLGLMFTALWGWMGKRRIEPSTPVKFALGLIQLGLGFGAFWYGAQQADERGMVAVSWLFLGYLLQTTGELCISPVGLSMVTRMAPAFLVSTVMGMWFLATAFSQFLAAIIAQFTGVGHGEGGTSAVPIPKDTVNIYGDVFWTITVTAIASGVLCLVLSPLLKKWMHESPNGLDSNARI